MIALILAQVLMIWGHKVVPHYDTGVAWQAVVCLDGSYQLGLDCMLYGQATQDIKACGVSLDMAKEDFPKAATFSCQRLTEEVLKLSPKG